MGVILVGSRWFKKLGGSLLEATAVFPRTGNVYVDWTPLFDVFGTPFPRDTLGCYPAPYAIDRNPSA